MSYSGVSKGLTAIGAAMLLASCRSGSSSSLYQEFGESLPQLLSRFETGIPDMYPKAYRWVAEMREIAAFLSEDKAAAMIFEGVAQLYDRLATDIANEGKERRTLDESFAIKAQRTDAPSHNRGGAGWISSLAQVRLRPA
jgi:hypothetical protein